MQVFLYFANNEKGYNTNMQLVETVPNVSEGRRPEIIRCLAETAASLPHVRLLHIDVNPDANRTVFTLLGTPQAVVQSLFLLIQEATRHIDMRQHHGAHPRLGAVDVCPLVPVRGISIKETAQLADELAQRIANELHIPIYLYEDNARTQERKNLAFIRRGEYENLAEKLHILPPDFGPAHYNEHIARTGATVVGARNFLIAFNMSLNTKEITAAQAIAKQLREKNGGLKSVKAIGWYMQHYGCAQVSCNLTDYTQTGLAEVFETCKKLAAEKNLQVTAGELIGLVPQNALVQAGRFYLPNETNTAVLINAAAENLLLGKIRPFIPRERVLEYLL